MADEKKTRRSRSRPKPAPTSLTAAAAAGGAVAGQPAPPVLRLVEIVKFEFTADRFGFATAQGETEDEIKYARDALRALTDWAEVMGELFGDIDQGLRVAGDARIMLNDPTWNSTSEARKRVHDNLGADLDAHGWSDWPERDSARRGGELTDQKTRDAVEELRIYLRMLWTWRKTFEAGLWIAMIAARGSIESDPHRRLLQGLGAIVAVCEFELADTPERIQSELVGIARNAFALISDPFEKVAFTAELASAVSNANLTLDYDFPMAFVVKPSMLTDWAHKLRDQLIPLQRENRLPPEHWEALEGAYWRQWNWSVTGPSARRQLAASPGKMTILDLMVAARYDGETFLSWRGGMLSISQWSRILAVASPQRLELMRAPADAALGQLGFSELIKPLPPGPEKSAPSRSSGRAVPPLVALSIFSKDSALLQWRPDPAVRAFALPQPQRYEADLRIAHYGTEVRSIGLPLLTDVIVRSNEERGAARLHLIEVAPGQDFGKFADAMSCSARGTQLEPCLFRSGGASARHPPAALVGPQHPRAGTGSAGKVFRAVPGQIRSDLGRLVPGRLPPVPAHQHLRLHAPVAGVRMAGEPARAGQAEGTLTTQAARRQPACIKHRTLEGCLGGLASTDLPVDRRALHDRSFATRRS